MELFPRIKCLVCVGLNIAYSTIKGLNVFIIIGFSLQLINQGIMMDIQA
jgi:hypothetical protein